MQNNSSATPLSSSFTNVFSRAFSRTNERLSLYLGAQVWSFLLIILTIVVGILLEVAIFSLYRSQTLSLTPAAVIAGIVFVAFIVGLYYLQILVQLTIIRTLVQPEYTGYFQTLRASRAFVGRFIGAVVKIALVTLLFLPLDMILCTYLHISVFQFLWSMWSMYTMFVIFDYSYSGTDSLYFSRQIVNRSFFQIIGKYLLIWLMIGIIFIPLFAWMALTFFRTPHLDLMVTFLQIAAIVGLVFLFVFYVVPFTISFTYELYRSLPKPQNVQKPSRYLFIAAIIGIVVSVILFSTKGAEMFKKNQDNNFLKPTPSQQWKTLPNFRDIFSI